MENEDKCGVYQIVCKTTGKRYIGSTTISFIKRWADHIGRLNNNKHHCSYLQRAWNKYGSLDFGFFILDILEKEDCMRYEQEYFNTVCHDLLYNSLFVVGALPKNYKNRDQKSDKTNISDETRRNLSEAAKLRESKKIYSSETIEKMRNAKLGKKRCSISDEHKKKISESNLIKEELRRVGKNLSEKELKKIEHRREQVRASRKKRRNNLAE